MHSTALPAAHAPRRATGSAMLLAGLCLACFATSPRPAAAAPAKTVVLVHGAFIDGSAWSKVIPLLEARGLKAVAVQNPLYSLTDDVAATKRVIEQQSGPVILVGNSYAGAVITEAGIDPKVESLVYVAAVALDKGQSVGDIFSGGPAPAWVAELQKDSGDGLTLPLKAIQTEFAQDVPAEESKLLASAQVPWGLRCQTEKVTAAAWQSKPSTYVLTTNDKIIDPKGQEQMAKSIGAKIVRVDASHAPMLSKPKEVADAIIAAAEKSNKTQ